MKDRATAVVLSFIISTASVTFKAFSHLLGKAAPTHMLRICVNPLSAGVGNACTNLLGFLA